jgi:phosphatidylglycerophosphatase A
MTDRAIKFLATGAYSGLSPVMPGTAGTLAALPLAYALSLAGPVTGSIAIIVAIFASVSISGMAERVLGRKDPPSVVIDEVVGFFAATWLLPFTATNAISAFLIFRFFDIVKPYPVRALERRLPGGWGIVMDDVMAGVMTNIAVRVINYLLL